MSHLKVCAVFAIFVVYCAHAAPQFGGGFSQASANAQAGAGFGPARPPIQGPFGQGGFGQGGFGQGGFGQGGFGPRRQGFGQGGLGQGGSVSISKSISISRGGSAQASSNAAAGGK